MATVTSLTYDKIQELVAGWEGVSLSQDQLNSLVQQLWNNNETQDALLAEFRDVTLPQLEADLAAGSIRVSDLNDNIIPGLEAQLDQHDLSLTNLNTVDIPNLNTQLLSNSNWILEFDGVTIPALNARLDANDATLLDLNTTVIPGLTDRLVAVENSAGGSFDPTSLQNQIDINTQSLSDLNTIVLPGLDTRLDSLETAPGFDPTGLQSQLDALDGKFPITAPDLAADSVTANAIAADSVTASEIAARTITALEIAVDAITANEISADSITANEIAVRTITATEIAVDAITANEIATDTITANEIAADSITAIEIAARTITAAEIAVDAITANEIASQTITSAEIAAHTITAAEIFARTITSAEIKVDTITANEIAADSITASEIAARTITAAEIAVDAITANEIAADSITASEIAARTITAAEIAVDAITANEIAADSITASEIAARTITAAEIAVDAITANEIAADSITASEIAAGTITAAEIAVDAITANQLAANAIDGMTITGVEVFGGSFVSDNPLASGVQVIIEETPDDSEFSKSGRMRFVTGETGVTDGIVIGSVIDYAGDSKGRRLFIRPPYAQTAGVGPLEAPNLSLEAMSGDANPAVAGTSWGRAGMFAPVLSFQARPDSVGSATTFDGGLILYTHAGAGGDPESRIRLGNKEVTLGVKDAAGVLQKGRIRVDQLQTRFDAPNAAGVVDERVRLDNDETLIYSPNKQDYIWLKDNDFVMSKVPRFLSTSFPIARRYRDADQSIANDNVNFSRVTWNANTDLQSITYSAGVFTCAVAGYYMVVANIFWAVASAATGRRLLEIRVNGVTQGRDTKAGATAGFSQNLAVPVYVPAGGTVDVWALQNSGAALAINGSATTPEYTWVKMLLEAAV